MNRVTSRLGYLLGLILVIAASASAQSSYSEMTAHEVVQSVQDNLLRAIEENRTAIDEAPAQYYAAVEMVLDPVVDFRYIARVVMGGYARKATPEQQALFTKMFKRGLVNTYARGMASYADRQIAVLPPQGDISGQRKVSVAQEVRGGDKVNRVSYTMARNRKGEWKLINVVLNGINLGKTFRGQFSQAMKKTQGDMDKVIAEWSADS